MTAGVQKGFSRQDVEIIGRELLHDGFLKIEKFRVKCRLFEGGWSSEFFREVLHREQGIGVLLYDPLLDQVLLVEQFRIGCLEDHNNGPWALELVAGLLEPGEDPESVARREVEEESGVTINGLLPIVEYYNSPGGSSEKLSVFCARFDARHAGGIFGLASEAENIRTVIMAREAAVDAIGAGRINNAMSIIALQWLQLNLPRVRAELLSDPAWA
jgi:ADP-ribose pyrophosphatase